MLCLEKKKSKNRGLIFLDVLGKNALYPFFWQHGEDHGVLGHYMEKIAASGMKGICIEARPHPDFAGRGWWKDMDFLIEKAKALGMKMWILDDSHFPTGYANGKVKEKYPQYLKQYLDMRRYDVQGSFQGARIDFSLLKGKPWDKPDHSEQIIGVYMAKRADAGCVEQTAWGYRDDILENTLTDITPQMQMDERLLKVDIPEGAYSIFVVYITKKGGEDSTKDYLNPLVKEATQILIDEVYEPHFTHYEKEFGKTIQGFFSDEPRFGNKKGTEARIGCDMVLPWRENLEKELGFEEKYLPLLWVNANGGERRIRFQYMDTVSRLYRDNFTKVLGNWCKRHGVWYLGHTIEDNGAHARLGYGTGHYFRGQQGMDMAGIDVIGGQIVPGMNYHHDAFNTGGSNGEFYHYALAKLASSAAHLDPQKCGRAMCEAFGAYGWNEGLKMMKWIADHLLVRGINYLVPHAFSPKEFPDFDCPPHFFAQGHNPQFRYFPVFCNYVNRICSLFRGGIYPAKTGVLYPAELEWAGEYMPVEKAARKLTENQISFDIVTRDQLLSAELCEKAYVINQTRFEVLVIPYGKYIPEDLAKAVNRMRGHHIRIIALDGAPEKILDGDDHLLDGWKQDVVPLARCKTVLKEYRVLHTKDEYPELAVGEYLGHNRKIYMLFNENIGNAIDTEVRLQESDRDFVRYDAFEDRFYELCPSEGAYHLHLEPYESVIWISKGEETVYRDAVYEEENREAAELAGDWKVYFSDCRSYPDKWEEVPMKYAGCVEGLAGWEKKTGTLRYERELSERKAYGRVILDLGEVFETAEVFVNGKSAGYRICPPYRFDVTGLLERGRNQLAVEVTNTLGTSQRDAMSHYLPIEPFGLRGPVKIIKKEKNNGSI